MTLIPYIFRSRVGIAQLVQRNVLGWTVRGSNSGVVEIFPSRPDSPWDPPSLPYNGHPVFPGVKRPGSSLTTPSPSAEDKIKVEPYLYFPLGPSWPVLGRNWPLPYRLHSLFLVYLMLRGREYMRMRHTQARSQQNCKEAKFRCLCLDVCHGFLIEITISPITFKVYNHPTN